MQKIRVPDDLVEAFLGSLDWYFSPSERRYYSFRGDQIHSRIRGANLPDPNALFAARCEANGVNTKAPEAGIYKPQQDTYKLWEDWAGRQ